MTIDTAQIDSLLTLLLRGEKASLPATPLDVREERDVLSRMRFHGVAMLLAKDEGFLEAAPGWLCRMAQNEARLLQIWEATHREALLPVLEGLAAAGVENLLMKGTALAYSLYPDAAMRPRGDSDLLVRPGALGAAREVLHQSGLERRKQAGPSRYQETWQSQGGFGVLHQIDLHWQTNPAPALQHLLLAGEFFAGKRALDRLSPHAAAPDQVQTFLHCVINQAAHTSNGYFVDGDAMSAGGRLSWAYDIHLLVGSFTGEDWARLVEAARRKQMAPSVLRALEESRRLLGTELPDDAVQCLSAQSGECAVTAYFDRSSPVRKLWLDVRGAGSLRSKAAEAVRHLFPDQETMRHLHPEYPDWPPALLQMRRIGGYLRRLLAGGRNNA